MHSNPDFIKHLVSTAFRQGLGICLCLLLGNTAVFGQLPWDKMRSKKIAYEVGGNTKYAEVQIAYTIRSQGMTTGRIGLRTLGQKIDVAKFPDASIEVHIRVVSLPSSEEVFVCSACYLSKINGFAHVGFLSASKRRLTSGDVLALEYKYSPKYLENTDKGNISFGFWIVPIGSSESLKDYYDYVEYTLLNTGITKKKKEDPTAARVEEMMSNPEIYCGSSELRTILANSSVSELTKKQLIKLCDEYSQAQKSTVSVPSKKPSSEYTEQEELVESSNEKPAASSPIASKKEKSNKSRSSKSLLQESDGGRLIPNKTHVRIELDLKGKYKKGSIELSANARDVDLLYRKGKIIAWMPNNSKRDITVIHRGKVLATYTLNTTTSGTDKAIADVDLVGGSEQGYLIFGLIGLLICIGAGYFLYNKYIKI